MTDAVIHLFNIEVVDTLEDVTIDIHIGTGDTSSPRSDLELHVRDGCLGSIQFYVTEEPGKFSNLTLVACNNKFL